MSTKNSGDIKNFPRLHICIERGEAFHRKDADPSERVCDALHTFVEELSLWLGARYDLPFSICAFTPGKSPAGNILHSTGNITVTAKARGSDDHKTGTLLTEIVIVHPLADYPRLHVYSTDILNPADNRRGAAGKLDKILNTLLRIVISATCDGELQNFWQGRNGEAGQEIIRVTYS